MVTFNGFTRLTTEIEYGLTDRLETLGELPDPPMERNNYRKSHWLGNDTSRIEPGVLCAGRSGDDAIRRHGVGVFISVQFVECPVTQFVILELSGENGRMLYLVEMKRVDGKWLYADSSPVGLLR